MARDNNATVPMPPLLSHPKFKIYADEPVYDPDVHLSLTEPEFVVLLDNFRHVPKAPKLNRPIASNGDSQLAYTGPFRLLSDEGYQVLLTIIKRESVHQESGTVVKSFIGHCGYRSKWIQDFNRCPRVLEHLSEIIGDVHLLPTAFQSYYSQINVGTASETNVLQFHVDSVPYVAILLACDMSQTIGGELQLIEREQKEAFHLIEQYKGQVPDEYIRTIDYLGPNSCVLMQGTRIAHRVTPIQSCSEPRLSLVNSYISTDPFAADCTRIAPYNMEVTTPLEYAMHKSWRVHAQMLDLATGDHPYPTRNQIIERFTMAIDELTQGRDLLSGTLADQFCYYDEETKKMYEDLPPHSSNVEN